MTARDVCAEIGAGTETIKALVAAEKFGQARVRRVVVICTGYADTDAFNAATALYTVRY
jgi:hypothetical protein